MRRFAPTWVSRKKGGRDSNWGFRLSRILSLSAVKAKGNGASGRKGMSRGLFNSRTDSGAGPRSSRLSCPQLRCAPVPHRYKSTRTMNKPPRLCACDEALGIVVIADLLSFPGIVLDSERSAHRGEYFGDPYILPSVRPWQNAARWPPRAARSGHGADSLRCPPRCEVKDNGEDDVHGKQLHTFDPVGLAVTRHLTQHQDGKEYRQHQARQEDQVHGLGTKSEA